MLVDFLKEMIKEKTYYKRIDDVIEIWQEKEKNTGKPYFVIKLLGNEIEIIDEDKKIEKIQQRTDTGLFGSMVNDEIKVAEAINKQANYLSDIVSTINEIIDKLNEMEKE